MAFDRKNDPATSSEHYALFEQEFGGSSSAKMKYSITGRCRIATQMGIVKL